jgi:hypothetical protein
MTNETRTSIVAAGDDCSHPAARRTYLGNMGPTAMYRCEGCHGVVLSVLSEGDEE